jgi:ribosome recycling factor
MTINHFKENAQKAVLHFEDVLKTIRTGRANPALVENLEVNAYGSKMPLMQLATISVPEPRLISISAWDKDIVPAIVEAIKKSDLNLNPTVDTTLIKLNIPPMTEERRKELIKLVGKYAEDAKIVLRNIRQEFRDSLKKREKDEKIPENEVKNEESKLEAEMKVFNEKIDEIAENKSKELMTI